MTGPDMPPAPGFWRTVLALIVASAVLAAICAALAWGVYALNFDDDYGVSSRASFAALAIGGALAAFSCTAAPLAIWALRALGRRSGTAFALAGAAAGAVFVLAVTTLTGAHAAPAAIIALAALGALHLLIVRAVAGVRAPR